jgi:hypothetical protein
MIRAGWIIVRRGVLAGMLCLSWASCRHDGPTEPSPPDVDPPMAAPLRISAERYFLQVSASDLTSNNTPWCQPIAVPSAGKFLSTFIWFERHGEEYIGRSRVPYRSTLEVRIRRIDAANGVATVRGTVTGAAHDEYDRLLGRRDLLITIASGESATFTGVATQQRESPIVPPPEISGTIEGSITFSDSTGAVSRCPTAAFYFQVAPPGGAHDDPTVPPLVPGRR